MFEHHQTERLIEALIANTLSNTQLMATLQQVIDAQATETQAIHDLTARLAAQPPAAATDAQLDPILATAQQNAAAINGLAQAPAPAPAA